MKRLIAIAVLIASVALAGELCSDIYGRPMVLTPRGASANNKGATNGTDSGFSLPASQKITVQCSNPDGGAAASNICINTVTCTAIAGILITGNQALPTSTAVNQVALADGGHTALISAYSVDNNNCIVCTRQGTEF